MNNNIEKIRKSQGVTLNQLSKKTGISLGYLSHLERGTRNNPSYNTMKKICFALEKSINEIFNL